MSTDKVQDITLEAAPSLKAVLFQGADREARVTLKPLLSKGGNVYWAVPGSKGMFGIPVRPAKGFTGLPMRIALENQNGVGVGGEVIDLKAGLTEDGRPKVTGSKLVTIPVDGDVKRLLQVTVSVKKDGNWNLKVSAHGIGGGGQEAVDLFE